MPDLKSGGGRPDFGRIFGGPGKYVQRAGELMRLAEHILPLGRKAFVLIDGFVFDSRGAEIAASLRAAGIEVSVERFGGECCDEEIDRVSELMAGHAVAVGIGGGKTADTTKMAAIKTGARIVIAPTIASTDAPCSAIAVRYDSHGVYRESHFLPRNPDAVIVDSAVIAKAPARFLVAGIGDALSTWFEARSNIESNANNLVSPNMPPAAAGIAIAKACHEVLMRDALAATRAVERGALTQAVENIIEANTLLSGLGFENCGVSAAHGIHDGLTVLDETHEFFHGEKVAFGVICLLVLEGRPFEEIAFVAHFCRSLGLPTRLADLNLANAKTEDLGRVAEAALAPGSATWKVPVPLSVDIVRDAIVAADAITRQLDQDKTSC
jgi:glycerol dehydrogenase